MKTRLLVLFLSLCWLAACASKSTTEVTVMDFRNTRGAYIMVYSTDMEFRTMFEDRLVADLAARDMLGFASYPDLPDVKATNRQSLLTAANAQKAMFVLVVEEVPHGKTGVVQSSERITQEHPTLKDFYANTRPADHEHEDDAQVFVEVSAFLIQGEFAKLVWSGTTWSLQADGESGRISGLSATIADAIDEARRKRGLGFE